MTRNPSPDFHRKGYTISAPQDRGFRDWVLHLEVREQYLPGYMRMLADLEQRVEQIKTLLPALCQQAEAIIDANSDIA
jgi:hypothetical protein